MNAKGAALGEPFVTDITLVRLFACVSPSMFDQVLLGAEGPPAELTKLRLLASVYSNVSLHVPPPDQLAAYLAGHLALASVRPEMLLITVAVESLEPADLALVLLSCIRLAVKLHVTPQVHSVAEGLVADIAGAGLLVTVHAHVRPQGRLQVEALVANLAELGELFVVPSNVELQVILGCQLGTADVANVGRPVQRFVNVQVLLLLENFVAYVALHWISLPFFVFHYFHGTFRFLLLLRDHGGIPAACSPMLEQLHLPFECLVTNSAGVLPFGLEQRFSCSKDRLLGLVHQ